MTTRQFKKRGIYKSWKNEDMKKALKAFAEGMTVNRAATLYNIPKTTFKRKIVEYDLENSSSRSVFLLKEAQKVEISPTVKNINATKHYGKSRELVRNFDVKEINLTPSELNIPTRILRRRIKQPYWTETSDHHSNEYEEFQQEMECMENSISKEIASENRNFGCKIKDPHSEKCHNQPEGLPKKDREAERMISQSAKKVEVSKNTLENINQHFSEKRNDQGLQSELAFVNHPPCSTSNIYGLTKKGTMDLAYEETHNRDACFVDKKKQDGNASLRGFTNRQTKSLAYEETHNRDACFVDKKKQDGNASLSGFMNRHSESKLWQEGATSTSSSETYSMNHFFDMLKSLMDENQITSSRIFSMDEMCHSVVIHSEKVAVQSGKHRFASATSCERTENITGLYAANAAGSFIPPMLIFARDNIEDGLIPEGAPLGTIFKCQGDGLMNATIFTEWMAHFIDTVKPNVAEKVILLLDGYKSYTRTLRANELAQENGVLVLSLPLQHLRDMRPLDITFFKVLNSYIGLAITNHLKENAAKPLTAENIASYIGTGFLRAATIETAVGGFRETGLWPVHHTNLEVENHLQKETTTPEMTTSEVRSQKQRSHKQKHPKKIIQNLDHVNNTIQPSAQTNEQILHGSDVGKNASLNIKLEIDESSIPKNNLVTNPDLDPFQSKQPNLPDWTKRTRHSSRSFVNTYQQSLENSTEIGRQNWISAS